MDELRSSEPASGFGLTRISLKGPIIDKFFFARVQFRAWGLGLRGFPGLMKYRGGVGSEQDGFEGGRSSKGHGG